MQKFLLSLSSRLAMALLVPLALNSLWIPAARASDHADGPSIAQDPGADIGDAYFFLDPNDNSQAVIAMTVRGFLAPGETPGSVAFDPKVKFFFEIENTGDAVSDLKLSVKFQPPATPGAPQRARVKGLGADFFAPTTPATLAASANAQSVTTDDATGIKFFAGPVDDPFFFDLVGFQRFADSARAGTPNFTFLQRGRDTFAGYNTLAIALRVPVSSLRGTSSAIGLQAITKRRPQTPLVTGGYEGIGSFVTVDRAGNPGINALLVPPARQDEYNAAKPGDDAARKFAGDIGATLRALGTKDVYVSIFESIVESRGDYLHLDLSISNKGGGGGVNPEAGFPNGRRPADDVVDTLLTTIANGSPLGDGVSASDVAPKDIFPFFALPHQPQ